MNDFLTWLFTTGYCDATILHSIVWLAVLAIFFGAWHFTAGFIRGVRQARQKPLPMAYCIGIVQMDGDDLDGAKEGDLIILMKDTPENRKVQCDLMRNHPQTSIPLKP